MSIVLFRVDERLIHGQVLVGWGTQLRPDAIVVVDDALSVSEWEQELYTLGLPAELETRFESVESARSQLGQFRSDPKRYFVLTRDVASMRRLAEGGLLAGEDINIGGLHHGNGRQQRLPYVFLSDDEVKDLAALAREGATVSARDLPGSRRVSLEELVRGNAE